jgi:hypothetical protein
MALTTARTMCNWTLMSAWVLSRNSNKAIDDGMAFMTTNALKSWVHLGNCVAETSDMAQKNTGHRAVAPMTGRFVVLWCASAGQ